MNFMTILRKNQKTPPCAQFAQKMTFSTTPQKPMAKMSRDFTVGTFGEGGKRHVSRRPPGWAVWGYIPIRN